MFGVGAAGALELGALLGQLVQIRRVPRNVSYPCQKLLNPKFLYGGFPKLGVPFLGGPYNKDYSILGSILGVP